MVNKKQVMIKDVMMPGDIVEIPSEISKERIILGPGLRRDGDTIYACKAGILKVQPPSIYYIDSYQKR